MAIGIAALAAGPAGSVLNEAVGIFDVHVNAEETLVVE